MLGRWVDGTIISLTKRLMFQVLFFYIISCKIICKNIFNLFIFYFFITLQNIKSFEFPKLLFYFQSIKIILGPSDAWSMRRLTQRPSVSYWRLSDFTRGFKHAGFELERVKVGEFSCMSTVHFVSQYHPHSNPCFFCHSSK